MVLVKVKKFSRSKTEIQPETKPETQPENEENGNFEEGNEAPNLPP